VVLFERGVVEWDEDLLIDGRAGLETLVKVGMGIGKSDARMDVLSWHPQPRQPGRCIPR